MKKLFLLLFILGISSQIFAQLENKHVVGNWKYNVVTDQGELKGLFKFVEKEGKLAGEVSTDDGYVIPFSKIEFKEGNTLYLEVQTDNDVIKISVKIEGNKFKGTGTSYQGDAPITGEKQV